MQPTTRDAIRPAFDAHLRWLDAAKGIALLSVVALHAAHWVDLAGAPTTSADAVIALLCVPLPVFFVLSGMLSRSVVDPTSTWLTVARRAVPLLWAYAAWQPLVLAYRVLGAVGIEDHGAVDWHGELLRLAATPIRPNGELWYLWALAIHLALAHATRRVPLRWLLPLGGTFFAAWFGLGEWVLGEGLWHALGPGLQGLPMFVGWTVLGTRAPGHVQRFVESIRPWPGCLLVGAWMALAVSTQLAPADIRSLIGVPQVLLGVPSTLVIARLLVELAPCRTLRRIGTESLPVYVLHTFTMVALLSAVLWMGGHELIRAVPTLTLVLVSAVATAVPLVLYRVVMSSRASVLLQTPIGRVVRTGSP